MNIVTYVANVSLYKSNDKILPYNTATRQLDTEIGKLYSRQNIIEYQIIKELNGSFFQLANGNILIDCGGEGDPFIAEKLDTRKRK